MRTNRSQGGSGGAYAMHTRGGSLTLEECTFSETWAMNGGCVAISVECSSLVVLGCSFSRATAAELCGGVFYFQKGHPEVVTIRDSVVDQAYSGVGSFIWAPNGLWLTDFTMTNTTLNMCETIAVDGILTMSVYVSGTFVFENNTIANSTRQNAVKFFVTNTSLAFQDCLFENLDSVQFALHVRPYDEVNGVIKSIVVRDCIFCRTRTRQIFNCVGDGRISSTGITCTLENCSIEDIIFHKYENMCGWLRSESSSKPLCLRNCKFVGASGDTSGSGPLIYPPVLVYGYIVNITECLFMDMPNVGVLRLSKSSSEVVLEDVDIWNCAHAVNTTYGKRLLCQGLNCSKSPLCLQIQFVEVRDSVFTELVGGSGKDRWCYVDSLEAFFEGCKFQGAATSEIRNGLIHISNKGPVTFARCCFQGAPPGVAYIRPASGGNVTFVDRICFSKTQEESFTEVTDGLNGLENCKFECTECEPGQQTSERSEDLDTTEPEPAETSSATDTKLGGDSGNNGNGLAPGVAAGVAISVIVVVAVTVALVVLFFIRRRKQDDDDVSVDMETVATVHEGASPTNPFMSIPEDLDDFSL